MYKIIRKLSEQKFYVVNFLGPGRCNSIDRSLRRTLVRLEHRSTVDGQQSTKESTVQVCDATEVQ